MLQLREPNPAPAPAPNPDPNPEVEMQSQLREQLRLSADLAASEVAMSKREAQLNAAYAAEEESNAHKVEESNARDKQVLTAAKGLAEQARQQIRGLQTQLRQLKAGAKQGGPAAPPAASPVAPVAASPTKDDFRESELSLPLHLQMRIHSLLLGSNKDRINRLMQLWATCSRASAVGSSLQSWRSACAHLSSHRIHMPLVERFILSRSPSPSKSDAHLLTKLGRWRSLAR